MDETASELEAALDTLGKPSPWSADIKVTDDFLDPLFEKFFKKLGLPNLMRETDYHELAKFVQSDALGPEVKVVLDAIQHVADR